MMKTFVRRALAAVTLAVGLSACAPGVNDIDRTQANRVSKATFAGEWFFRPAVIETQYNQGMLFEGLEGELERIKWDIRQHELVAYRSWQQLEGAELGNGDTEFRGNPVAIFLIESHFDVQRQYNESTGEQSNIIQENTTDRPWYERKYMRVDWSVNLLNNAWSLEGAVQAMSGAPFYVQEHEVDSPYRAEITASNINIVNNYHLMTDFNTCYYMFLDPYMCGNSQVKMKLSFMKVADRDYEPLYYPDQLKLRNDADQTDTTDRQGMFERFGFFRTKRQAYDDEFQWIRDNRVFLANRWNIWKKSRLDDGSYAPMASREPGKITYYTNADFPEDADVWDASVQLVNDWDFAFRDTVAAVRGLAAAEAQAVADHQEEIRKALEQNPDLPESQWPKRSLQAPARVEMAAVDVDAIPRIYELKPNSCNVENVNSYVESHGHRSLLETYGIGEVLPGNLKRACSLLEWASNGDFQWQKIGDLRHSFLHWVDTPQNAGPLGYGPSAADPVTGEIISANANIYGAAIDSFASFAADVVALMNGEIGTGDIAEGVNIRDQIIRKHGQRFGLHSADKMAAMRARHSGVGLDNAGSHAGGAAGGAHAHEHGTGIGHAGTIGLDALRSMSVLGGRGSQLDARVREHAQPVTRGKLERLIGSDIERELLASDDLKRAMSGPQGLMAGAMPTSAIPGIEEAMGLGDGAANNAFSPISAMLHDGDLGRKHHEAMMKAAEHSIMMAEWSDAGMLSLAEELKGRSWEEVYRHMRREIYRGVMAHEVGHTIGLRHNFEGSYDPLNYHGEFWDSYNAETGKVDRLDAEGRPTRAERLMYSSIMDYDARFYADSLEGIGPYDRAAIRFGYGLVVEEFSHAPNLWFGDLMSLSDYTDIPKVVSGATACNQGLTAQACTPYLVEVFRQGGYYQQMREAEQRNDTLAEAEAREQMGRHQLSYLKASLESSPARPELIWNRSYVNFNDIVAATKAEGYYGGPEVPYKFCPDEFSGFSMTNCQPYDKGANFREITADRVERYEKYYFFNNFKRDRFAFNDSFYVNQYMGRLISRFFGQMSNVYRYYLFGQNSMGRDADGNELTLNDFGLGADWQAAAMDGLNALAAVIAQPEPGSYCLDQASNLYKPKVDVELTGSECNAPMEVPAGVGKYLMTKWTDEYYYKATRIGSFFDKYAALWSLTDNEGYFPQNFGDVLDAGAFALSYWRGLQDEMLGLFGNAFTGDTGKFAWRYNPNGGVVDRDTTAGTLARFAPTPVADIYENNVDLASLPRIESANSWTLRYYGVVLPMARFNSMYDYSFDFSNYANVCLEGYRDCRDFEHVEVVGDDGTVTTEPGVEGVDFTSYVDPLTGYRYLAAGAATDARSVGAKMLREAQSYVDQQFAPVQAAHQRAKAAYEAATADGSDATEEQQNALFDEMSRLEGNLRLKEEGVNQRTSFLDIIRRMGYLMEYGG